MVAGRKHVVLQSAVNRCVANCALRSRPEGGNGRREGGGREDGRETHQPQNNYKKLSRCCYLPALGDLIDKLIRKKSTIRQIFRLNVTVVRYSFEKALQAAQRTPTEVSFS